MSKAITLTPEVVDALNALCEEGKLDQNIIRLQNAEEAMQQVAYAEQDGSLDYLYRFSYELKLIRDEFEQLEKILGYEPDRE